jgi:hypothetical protein
MLLKWGSWINVEGIPCPAVNTALPLNFPAMDSMTGQFDAVDGLKWSQRNNPKLK